MFSHTSSALKNRSEMKIIGIIQLQ